MVIYNTHGGLMRVRVGLFITSWGFLEVWAIHLDIGLLPP